MSDTCSICLEDIKLNYKLKCGHQFCYLCLKFSLLGRNHTCPLCRGDVEKDVLENASVEDSYVIVEPQQQNVKWYYAGRKEGYWQYDPIAQQLLNEAYQQNFDLDIEDDFNPRNHTEDELVDKGLVPILIGGINTFYFNFKEMYQYNHRNGAIRNIKRIENDDDMKDELIKGIAGINATFKKSNGKKLNNKKI